MESKLITIREASIVLGLSSRQIQRLIRAHRLKGKMFGDKAERFRYVTRSSLESLIAEDK